MAPKRLSPFLVKKIGNWDGAMDFFKQMGMRVKTVTLQSQKEICKELRDRVIKHIVAQDLEWPSLSEITKKIKNQTNKDLILIDTELYMKSIKMWQVGNTWIVGVKKGIVYRRKGSFMSVDRVAILLEFGTTRMPARPLWQPTMNELGGAKGIRNYVAKKIYEKLKDQAKGTPVQITKKDILDKIR